MEPRAAAAPGDSDCSPKNTVPAEPNPLPSGYQSAALGSDTYDFYRCFRCHRLLTNPEVVAGLQVHPVKICPCGALKFSPTDPHWYEYVLPRVIRFAIARARELGVDGIRANLAAKR